MICGSCKKEVPVLEKVGFRAECPHCEADLHICLLCKFYDPSVYNECQETSADRVVEKDRSNFCEYFVPSDGSSPETIDPADDTKKKLEDLFKKS